MFWFCIHTHIDIYIHTYVYPLCVDSHYGMDDRESSIPYHLTHLNLGKVSRDLPVNSLEPFSLGPSVRGWFVTPMKSIVTCVPESVVTLQLCSPRFPNLAIENGGPTKPGSGFSMDVATSSAFNITVNKITTGLGATGVVKIMRIGEKRLVRKEEMRCKPSENTIR